MSVVCPSVTSALGPCRRPEPEKYGALHVDHDHSTKRVRGLLCGQCNTGIGKFRDNPELLRAVIDYLMGQPDGYAPLGE